jgi:hypothetical protein
MHGRPLWEKRRRKKRTGSRKNAAVNFSRKRGKDVPNARMDDLLFPLLSVRIVFF